MTARSQATPADAVATSWVEHAPIWFQPWARLARLDRPIGTWLLFWPCVFGLILGAAADERRFLEWRDLYYVVLFGIGSLVMRGAGCTFNDIVDRKIDAQVARTRGRAIPSGAISVTGAVFFLILQCLAGLAVLLQFNWFAVALGAASLLLVAAYPFMKRITWWPQAWLGLTFNWGALLGYAAATHRLDWPAVLLYASGIFWTLGYDTIYAVQDLEDDALAGVKSSARRLGANAPPAILAFYLASLTILLAMGSAANLGPFFYLALIAYGIQLCSQARRVRVDDPAKALRLFKSNSWAGLILVLAIVAGARFVLLL
jgi:4-hydroxybenzoate polyprenyltransferase